MNIPSIHPYNVSFGQVRRSAVANAIRESFNDINKLKTVRDIVADQYSNTEYDITCDNYGSYWVHKCGTQTSYLCDTFEEAGKCANDFKERDAQFRTKKQQNIINKREAAALISKLTDSCEE